MSAAILSPTFTFFLDRTSTPSISLISSSVVPRDGSGPPVSNPASRTSDNGQPTDPRPTRSSGSVSGEARILPGTGQSRHHPYFITSNLAIDAPNGLPSPVPGDAGAGRVLPWSDHLITTPPHNPISLRISPDRKGEARTHL